MQPLFAYQPEGLIAIALIGLIVAFTMPLYEALGRGKLVSALLALGTSIVLMTIGKCWIVFKDRKLNQRNNDKMHHSNRALPPEEKKDNHKNMNS
jgi:hypothetical protein